MWPSFSRLFYSISVFQRMHTARSPSSIPTGVSGDALDLSLSGSQLTMSKRPSSASPGKYFSRSVSVSVASENRGKRNTLVMHCQKVPVCGIKCSRCMNEKNSPYYLGVLNSQSDTRFGGSRSVKNLRRSNSTTQVNQQANIGLRYKHRLA